MDNSWSENQNYQYTTKKYVDGNDFLTILQNLKKCGVSEIQMSIQFIHERQLNNFMEVYDQQVREDENYYLIDNQNDSSRSEFKVNSYFQVKDSKYDSRQLSFRSYQEVKIFMKINKRRLLQLQQQFSYKLTTSGLFMNVFFPKGQKLSTFFINQIFELKTKLNLYYCRNPTVVQKIVYSDYFNNLMEKKGIAAEVHRRNYVKLVVFYSNQLIRTDIQDVVNDNLLEHITVVNIYDFRLHNSINQVLFMLVQLIIRDQIKHVEKQQQIKIQTNFQKCSILIHDRHQTFNRAKKAVQKSLENLIYFKLDGENMRTFYNKIIRNYHKFPAIRVKYTKKGLFCVFDHQIYKCSTQTVKQAFQKWLQQYCASLTQKHKITIYLRNKKTFSKDINSFLEQIQTFVSDTSIYIKNFQQLMKYRKDCSKIKLVLKQFSSFNIQLVKKQYFQVIMSILNRTKITCKFSEQFRNQNDEITNNLVMIKKVQIYKSNTQESSSKDTSRQAIEIQISSASEHAQQSVQLDRRASYDKKQRKQKGLALIYPFKQPKYQQGLQSFFELQKRQSKLQRLLLESHGQIFKHFGYRVYRLQIREKISSQNLVFEQKVYFSTIIQKNNKLCYHLIEAKEIHKINKDKNCYIFYKAQQKEIYLPAFVIKFL